MASQADSSSSDGTAATAAAAAVSSSTSTLHPTTDIVVTASTTASTIASAAAAQLSLQCTDVATPASDVQLFALWLRLSELQAIVVAGLNVVPAFSQVTGTTSGVTSQPPAHNELLHAFGEGCVLLGKALEYLQGRGWQWEPCHRTFWRVHGHVDGSRVLCNLGCAISKAAAALVDLLQGKGARKEQAVTTAAAQAVPLWLMYKPRSVGAAVLPVPSVPLRHRYTVRVLQPLLSSGSSAAVANEQGLLRRFPGGSWERLGSVLLQGGSGGGGGDSGGGGGAEWPRVVAVGSSASTTLGQRVNAAIHTLLAAGCDMVVLDCRVAGDAAGRSPDRFVPAYVVAAKPSPHPHCSLHSPRLLLLLLPRYPVVLHAAGAAGVVALTPLQVAQVNGVHPSVDDAGGVIANLLHRVANTMGAVVVAEEAVAGLAALLQEGSSSLPADATTTLRGVSDSYSAATGVPGLQRDGRVTVVKSGVAAAHGVPQCGHGWLGKDTRQLLAQAIAQRQPRVVLELGSW